MGKRLSTHPSSSDAVQPNSAVVVYVPPPDDVFSRFANAVCSELSRRKNDARFLDPDITGGFAAFLKLVAVIEVRRLNKGSQA